MKRDTFEIKGMTCNSCVKRIENKISKLNGVRKISVDLDKKNAYVEFDESKINILEIKESVFKLGYKVEGVDKDRGILKGILYGLLPHTGCFAFILLTILGLTAGATFLRPLLNTYFFYGLIGFSLILATISAIFYLKKHASLSKEGIKKKWKYLSILFGTTIVMNILFLTVIFPLATNATFASSPTNSIDLNSPNTNQSNTNISQITLQVNIPCSGHVFLINSEVTKDPGVINVDFKAPQNFTIYYDKTKTTKENILNNPIFKEFPAKII